jgi:DNA-binding transcriptional regulator GbsR (MarR family)
MTEPRPDADSALTFAQDELADVFGNIAAFWGFTKTQGRIYGLLFLCEDPMSHGDIQKRLGISAGSTSMTLSSLVQWGVLRRSGRLYVAETDMWKVITGVFRRRERDQVDNAIERVGHIVAALSSVEQPTQASSFALLRVRQLSEFFVLGRRFLDAFVDRGPVRDLLTNIATRAARFGARPPREPHEPHDNDAPIGN